ncbi:MAG: Rid family hydrolase [Bilophila wadsworthia]
MKTILSTADAPAAIGPYSQAVRSGEALYCSGQLGIDPATGKLPEGVAAQTEQSLKNIRPSPQPGRASKTVKSTVFITNMADFLLVNAEYPKYSPRILPPVPAWRSRNCPRRLVEIEVLAVVLTPETPPAPPTYGVNETLSPPFAARLTSLPAQDDAEEKKTRTRPENRRSFRFLFRRNRPVRAPVPSTAAPFSGLYCNFLE